MQRLALTNLAKSVAISLRPRAASVRAPVRASAEPPRGGEDVSESMKSDLERLRVAERQSANRFTSAATPKAPPPSSPLDGLKDVFDKILIADFFFIIAIMFWLAIAVALNETYPDIYTTWTALWDPWFQSAIGLFMAGALLSGAVSYVKDNLFTQPK